MGRARGEATGFIEEEAGEEKEGSEVKTIGLLLVGLTFGFVIGAIAVAHRGAPSGSILVDPSQVQAMPQAKHPDVFDRIDAEERRKGKEDVDMETLAKRYGATASRLPGLPPGYTLDPTPAAQAVAVAVPAVPESKGLLHFDMRAACLVTSMVALALVLGEIEAMKRLLREIRDAGGRRS
jgi:hypothetical protein